MRPFSIGVAAQAGHAPQEVLLFGPKVLLPRSRSQPEDGDGAIAPVDRAEQGEAVPVEGRVPGTDGPEVRRRLLETEVEGGRNRTGRGKPSR